VITEADIRTIPTFADLQEHELKWLADNTREQVMEPGDDFWKEDDVIEDMWIVFSGAVQFYLRQGGELRLFDTWRAGRILGVLPFSRMTHIPGRFEVIETAKVGFIHKSLFRDMIYEIPVLGQRLVAMMSDRVRDAAKNDQQREKMLALGKLSAGLAHELNNPAAAIKRAADLMRQRLEQLPRVISRLSHHDLTEDQVCIAVTPPSADSKQMSTVERSEVEDAVIDWLEEQEVDESWLKGPALVEAGFGVEDLKSLTEGLAPGAISDIVAWAENKAVTTQIVEEIFESAQRISELIGSVKSYSHMDRATTKQKVDIVDGLESTLTMLGHKVRGKGISVERNFGEDLPQVSVLPGELNQVWTNLIDNAIDAAPEGGEVRVETDVKGSNYFVRIHDNGSGIPDDVLPRIFEPFFTTKDVGEGTGLGLEIAHRIITQQHAGAINITSEPGDTTFEVCLPLDR